MTADPVIQGWRTARLVERRPEGRRAATLRFTLPTWPGHRAGQHADVRLTADDGYQAQRSYSIASAPEDPDLELTVEEVDGGEVSEYLVLDMQLGDELEIRGPIGGWFVWDVADGGPLLLVGGGSGLIPLMAMLRHRQRQASRVPVRLIVSVRRPEDLFYRDELRAMAGSDPTLELLVTVTRPDPGAPLPSWVARTGRVDADFLGQVAWPPTAGGRAYVCGSTPFVETATGILVDLGLPATSIRAERFGPSGTVDAANQADAEAQGVAEPALHHAPEVPTPGR